MQNVAIRDIRKGNRMVDVIVIGGGHAGVEAALACARLKKTTVLYSMHIDMIASMPCNPSVGGPAKGIVVREIDALGGEMGKAADATALQFKMLNTRDRVFSVFAYNRISWNISAICKTSYYNRSTWKSVKCVWKRCWLRMAG